MKKTYKVLNANNHWCYFNNLQNAIKRAKETAAILEINVWVFNEIKCRHECKINKYGVCEML